MDAAEKVVARDGAARLTLEAVAEQAGISKASVLYDYKSKQALIAAVVGRAVRNDNAHNDAVTASLGEVPSAAAVLSDRIDDQVARLADSNFPRRRGRVPGTFELVAHKHYVVIFEETATTITHDAYERALIQQRRQ